MIWHGGSGRHSGWRLSPFFVTAPLGVLYVILSVALVIAIMALQAAMGTHPIISIIVGLLAIVPFLNLFALLFVNMEANNILKNAGLTVGLMGVKPEELRRFMDPRLCRKCGYDLTGNASGYCPECGRQVLQRSGDGGHGGEASA
jgi:hypothetical protein